MCGFAGFLNKGSDINDNRFIVHAMAVWSLFLTEKSITIRI